MGWDWDWDWDWVTLYDSIAGLDESMAERYGGGKPQWQRHQGSQLLTDCEKCEFFLPSGFVCNKRFRHGRTNHKAYKQTVEPL